MTQNIRNRAAITDPRILGLIQECVTNTENMGFEVPTMLRFLERKNAVHTAGTAHHRQKLIVLSSYIYKESDDSIKSVIYHELGHIIAGPLAKHGPIWKKIVGKMTEVTGIKISRTYDTEKDMPIHAAELRGLWKHVFRCKGCGVEFHFVKETKFCRTYNQLTPSGKPMWTCKKCGSGSFEKIK